MSALDEFVKKKDFAVCVDSDGCAMDTMNIKHFRCFGPCLVDEWGLDAHREEILSRWNDINLFSMTRGINRFKGLALMLREVNDRIGVPIDGIDELEDWAEHAKELSNTSCEAMQAVHPVFGKALAWSIATNKAITALPEEEVGPYEGVRDALRLAHEKADVVVVSSANPGAVVAEWTRFGLIEDVDLLCTQDMGSKAYCIGRLLEKGYDPLHILMCGDAPGDDAAAKTNGVLCFPILTGREKESWQLFRDEALDRFLEGTYEGAYQEERRRAFYANLGAK